MKKLTELNPNTRLYWNQCYGDAEKRQEYAVQGTTVGNTGRMYIAPTYRFDETLKYVTSESKFLDIGCGVGVLTKLVKKTYPSCEVWGTDISDQAIKDDLAETPEIKYLHQYVGNQDKLPNDYFDVVFSGEVLEHLDEPSDLFNDAVRVLKTGGTFICTTPDQDHVKSTEHVWEFTHEDIEKLYLDNGFSKPEFIYLPDLESIFAIYAVGKKL